jgi:hypothetical protein
VIWKICGKNAFFFPFKFYGDVMLSYVGTWSRVSSVSIVSDYGLDDRAIGVRSPAEAKDFSSNLCVQTGSGAHPASCTRGTGVLSPGVKRSRGVTLELYLLSPKRLHGV